MTTINPVYNRIEAIFKLRLLQDFAGFSNALIDKNFWQELTELQAAIYRLDSHYENNRQIADWVTGECWKEIDARIIDLSDGKSGTDLARDIHSYEKIERSLRGQWWNRLPSLEAYYHLKTCDVRLCRKVILAQSKTKMTHGDCRAWELFDLIGEIFDDLSDFHEDLNDLNGNRFILGVLAHGVRATSRAYRELVEGIRKRVQQFETADPGTLKSSGIMTALYGCIESVSLLLKALTIDEAQLERLVGTSMLSTLGTTKCSELSEVTRLPLERRLRPAA